MKRFALKKEDRFNKNKSISGFFEAQKNNLLTNEQLKLLKGGDGETTEDMVPDFN